MALRTITVSGRAGLRSAHGDEQRLAILGRIDALLANLEHFVIRDGGDLTILGAIEAERRALYEIDAGRDQAGTHAGQARA